MPNGSYVLCPYFIAEKTTAVTCEDCVREFFTAQEKQEHMKKHCCQDWESCTYANSLSQVYDQDSGRPKDQIRRLELYNHSKAQEITRIKRRMNKLKSEKKLTDREVYAMKHRIVRMDAETDRLKKKVEEQEIIFREKERGLYALIGTMLTRFMQTDADAEYTLSEIREYGQRYETSYEIIEGQGAIRIIVAKKGDDESDTDRGSAGEVSDAGERESRGTEEDDEDAD